MSGEISVDKVKLNLAKLKKYGSTFEINIDPDSALQYKKGEITDLREVLLADNIFSDAKKGQIVSKDELQKAFQTTDVNKIAEIILKEGDIQATSDHRAEERQQRRRKLVNMIHTQAVDPTSNLPHPATRIEAALEQAKIHLVDHKTVEDQFDDVVKVLRPIIPLKIEQKEITVIIPSQYSGKAYNAAKSGVKVLKEEWKQNGDWMLRIELPAGLYMEYIEKVNSVTHGSARIEES